MASSEPAKRPLWHLSFTDRAAIPNTPSLTSYLLQLMTAKQTNLCLSADVQYTSQLLELAEECGDSICLLKTHADIVYDFSERTIKGLRDIAARKKFLIFEDRKFGDIGNTVQTQYAGGTHRIAAWASIVNAHIFPGPAVITALKEAAQSSLTAYNSVVSVEIRSGTNSEDGSEGDDGDENDERNSQKAANAQDNGEEDSSIHRRPPHLEIRKGSVVSITSELLSPNGTPGANFLSLRPPISRGLLLLAQMSSADNMFTPAYTTKCLELARQHREFVLGFVAQEALNREPEDNFLVLTPGVNLPPQPPTDTPERSNARPISRTSGNGLTARVSPRGFTRLGQRRTSQNLQSDVDESVANGDGSRPVGDRLGQQYNTPRHVILENGVDIIIVGRGIYNAEDRAAEAERYRLEGWNALQERFSMSER